MQGIRRGDMFIAKRYSKSKYHQVYKITNVAENGFIESTHLRYGETDDE